MLYRLSELGMIALAVLAGVGWASLGRITAGLSTVAILLEVALFSPVAGLPGHTDGRIPAAMFALASAPEGAVINFPIAGGRAYLYHQSAHGKPLAATLNFTANSTALTLWELCLALAEEMDPSVRAQLISGEAYRLGVRYLVAHPDPNVNPDSLSNAMQVIRSTYRPAIEGDGIEIYRFY